MSQALTHSGGAKEIELDGAHGTFRWAPCTRPNYKLSPVSSYSFKTCLPAKRSRWYMTNTAI
jgi:hypothetical protein